MVHDKVGDDLVYAEVGADVNLECNYNLLGDNLYSIKWYRDDREFFRYIPEGDL